MPVVTSPAPSWVHITAPAACPQGYQPLTVQARYASELEFLAQIDACATPDGTSTWINNNSSQVWRIYTTPGGQRVQQSAGSLATAMFRRADLAAGNRIATMEPNVRVLVPAPPTAVSWYADQTATGVYTQQTQIEEKLFEQIRDKAPEAFPEGRRRAMVTCGVAAYNLAELYADSQSADSLAETIESALGGAKDAAECRTAMQQADDVELREGRIQRPVLTELDTIPRTTKIQQLKVPIGNALKTLQKVVPYF